MKAICQDRYGSPDVLSLRDVTKPVPGDDEVLVRVRAASVNAYDWHYMRGDPLLPARMAFGLRGPRKAVRGRDFAGVVEAVGGDIDRFAVGDEVFGEADGTFAEFVCVPDDTVGAKPGNLTFEEAATLPLAAHTAVAGLRDRGEVKPGQTVLVIGASGGVGTFAVQYAAHLGAEVTGVCSARNAEQVRAQGAAHVIDYTKEDFARGEHRYDVVLDLVGTRPIRVLRRAVAPGGTLVVGGGGKPGKLLGAAALTLAAVVTAPFVRERVRPLTGPAPSREGLARLKELAEAGVLRPVIERTYPLESAPDAIRYMENEHARGKLVVTI